MLSPHTSPMIVRRGALGLPAQDCELAISRRLTGSIWEAGSQPAVRPGWRSPAGASRAPFHAETARYCPRP